MQKYNNRLNLNGINHSFFNSGNDFLGYDFSFFDDLGDEYYIEVKSIRNNRFILSDSEIKKAENAKDKYILALVFWENTTYLGLKYLKSPMKKLNTKMAKKRLEFLLE